MAAATVLTAGIVIATDEATSTAGMRLARMAALAPLITAASLLGVLLHARSRGELGALEALGATPWRATHGAAVAGAIGAAVSVVLLVSPWTDAASLFPAVHPALAWTLAPDGAAARAVGVIVRSSGAIDLTDSGAPPTLATLSPWAALPCIAPVACVVPSWAVTPMSSAARIGSVAATAMLAVTALHLVGAGRIPAAASVAVSLPLLAATILARR